MNKKNNPTVAISTFTELIPSTLTAQAMLSNVKCKEEDLVWCVRVEGAIKKVMSNYGEVFNVEYKENKRETKKNSGKYRRISFK